MKKFEKNWLDDVSDEGLLNEIRRVYALQNGRALTGRNFDLSANVGRSLIARRFGSWSEAMRKAGLVASVHDYSDSAIIADICRVSQQFPNVDFTLKFYCEHGKYSSTIIKRRLNGWQNALAAAAIGHRYSGPKITALMKEQPGRFKTDEQILQVLRSTFDELGGKAISAEKLLANSDVTQSLLYRRFGGVSAAFKKAEIVLTPLSRRYTDVEVFENLLNVWSHYGRQPTALEMDKPPSKVGYTSYKTRFGGWRKALTAFVDAASKDEESEANLADEPDIVEVNVVAANTLSKNVTIVENTIQTNQMRKSKVKSEDRREPSKGLRFKILSRDNFSCVLCGNNPRENSGHIMQVDHITPFSKGGKTREDNLRTLCAACNIGRGNRYDD